MHIYFPDSSDQSIMNMWYIKPGLEMHKNTEWQNTKWKKKKIK